jgi:diguanylate cyclase (GGDEF)-like protein
MTVNVATDETASTVRAITAIYARLLGAALALAPLCLVAYVNIYQDPQLRFDNTLFHAIATAVATLGGVFVTFVTWQCYRSSHEPLLRWVALGLLGFLTIFPLQGAFAGFAHGNMPLGLLYGPAARLVMATFLFLGLLSYGREPDAASQRAAPRAWLSWIALFIAIDVTVAGIAFSPIAALPAASLTMDGGALVLSGVTVAVMLSRRIRSPLMVIFGIAVTSFAISSLAFILAAPWSHMWWLANAIFAGGLLVMSYAIVQAFLTTRSFATATSQADLMTRLAEETKRAKDALLELKRTNLKLEQISATDPLTGCGNRHQFVERVEIEIARAERDNPPFSILSLDIDHFKAVNDTYGRHVGDEILRGLAQICREVLRPYDYVARVDGEKFMILLPETSLNEACDVGERLRWVVANNTFKTGNGPLTGITISVGATEFARDGETLDTLLRTADERLNRAKDRGRDCVIAA